MVSRNPAGPRRPRVCSIGQWLTRLWEHFDIGIGVVCRVDKNYRQGTLVMGI